MKSRALKNRSVPGRSWKDRPAVAVLFGIVLVVIMFGASEVVCGSLNRHRPLGPEIREDGLIRKDLDMGYTLAPNANVKSTALFDNQVMYSKKYSTDAFGRRYTPVQNPARRDSFLVFFGCSFTFGEGCNDDETLPFYVGEMARRYVPYNYGVRGYGPQQMLYLLQREELPSQIKQKKRSGAPVPFGVYVWIGDHINRTIGAMPGFNLFSHGFPQYGLKDGNVVWESTFETNRPCTSLLYNAVWKSQTLRFFNINLPLFRTEKDYDLAAAILVESARLFEQQFPGSDFYVLAYHPPSALYGWLEERLKQEHIKYLPPCFLPGQFRDLKYPDGHPRPEAHRIVARYLVDNLGIGK